jgi:hypothetical protein
VGTNNAARCHCLGRTALSLFAVLAHDGHTPHNGGAASP